MKKLRHIYIWYSNDMFDYMFKAAFVALVSLKVPSGNFTSATPTLTGFPCEGRYRRGGETRPKRPRTTIRSISRRRSTTWTCRRRVTTGTEPSPGRRGRPPLRGERATTKRVGKKNILINNRHNVQVYESLTKPAKNIICWKKVL